MIGNTVKDFSGTSYWVVVNSEGQLIVTSPWVLALNAEETANDSDKSFTVPASTEWKIHSIWVELTTTATVGDRHIELQIQDGSADVIMELKAGIVQAASLTRVYLFAPGVEALTAFRDTDYLSNPIPEIELPPTYVLRVWDNSATDAAADDMIVQIRYSSRTV